MHTVLKYWKNKYIKNKYDDHKHSDSFINIMKEYISSFLKVKIYVFALFSKNRINLLYIITLI